MNTAWREPLGWTPEDMLKKIDETSVDGDSYYQVRIHEIKEIHKVGLEASPGK